ncbi:MAG: SDR family NAD(P)-dependent oxidoreductase [Alphaproteobacteria bacterium]|jgi:meso-butanediol dehydrogenase/(S,S)-butanediol dehydrogenase/diacetyl reductase|nr:SDR family NAD(P)-dependent oxidoreductase [Alphaproteobacteria bacterium]MDE0814359.1 SDR family NAD(P)-dependent oxidoreductase [Alphaproteobacteria bacterium]|tara:strand:- start:142 stop:993 length:852 start_codon:yes stop_codon:yes gene_type:complete
MPSLEGKVALITGAGGRKGIGRATALKLAALGADIALTDVTRPQSDLPPQERGDKWQGIESVAEEVRAHGRKCQTVACDLSVNAEVRDLIDTVIGEFGKIDIMINNARAIIGKDRVPVWELDEAEWQHFLDINLTAVYLTIKYTVPHMMERGQGGRIINTASDASKRGKATSSAYSATKFGLLGLTQCAALDLAPHQITVNSVCPGSVNTDRMSYQEQIAADRQGVPLETYRAQLVEQLGQVNPLGRIVESEDVANLIAFLSSDEAEMITGQAYNVNGGTLFH